MESSLLPKFKTTSFSPTLIIHPNPTSLPNRSFRLGFQQLPGNSRKKLAIECCKGASQFASEREKLFEKEWEGIEQGWKEICDAENGIVELMECLEKEAIMGDDHGNHPADYNRRALIFDKSSRVFQALKNNNNESTTIIKTN